MSFFSKILKGLGFEDEEEKSNKQAKPTKVKDKKDKLKPDFATFDLKQEDVINKETKETVNMLETQPTEQQVEQPKNSVELDIIKVCSQVEVQNVVAKIKNNEQVIVNLSGLSDSDLTRSLDFLTGAVFALDKSMQKVDNTIFIIH